MAALNFPASPDVNDVFTANGKSFVWTGTSWANISSGYAGSQGDIGFTGSRGDTGFVGSRGDVGFIGSQGDIGFTGSRGDIGFTGSRGFTGSQGNVGFTGSQGDIGFTGSRGFTGSQGNVGFTGSQGNVGFTGSQGIRGTQEICFTQLGTLYVVAGATRWYVTESLTISNVIASLSTTSSGASVIVDVNKNGTTIFTTQGNRPTITAGAFYDFSSVPDVTSLTSGDYLTIDIDQVGSGAAGADLVVRVVLAP
jgi:hypothetical protein